MMRYAFAQPAMRARLWCVVTYTCTLTLLLTLLLTLTTPAIAAQSADSTPVTKFIARAPRGASGVFEISYDVSPLRAKPSSDLTAPILVRLNEIAPTRYRVEFMGLVSGVYDLAPYLEQVDGRTAQFTSPLSVEVFTQLPPNHGTDIFGLSAPSFGFRAHYREIVIGVAALWIAVPTVVIVRNLLRKKPKPSIAPLAHVPTIEEQLFALVQHAQARTLTVDERGRLELMLLRILRAHVSEDSTTTDSPAALAARTAALRTDPSCGPVIVAVEQWLHAENDGDARNAMDALERLKATRVSLTPGPGGAQ